MPLSRLAPFALAFLWFGLAAGPVGAAEAGCAAPAPGPDVACTEGGAVRGAREGDTLAFKGIPYARPPVGALRWRPPEADARWEGVRDGGRFGPVCPQLARGGEVVGDEDCLALNVWTPVERPATPLPVMVWLTGGGNHSFSGQGAPVFGGVRYDGAALVPRGVVLVTYNLRLGALGFLAHPALDAERPERVSGNYGSLDQAAMLRWVKRNIAAFGGDPGRVFLFGTSAGGGNICALMTSPLAEGLFHGAAMQSSVPTGCEIPTLAEVEATTGARVAQALGCSAVADTAACLRGKTAAEVVAAVPGTFGLFPRVYGPNMDGHVFPEQPIRRIAARRHQAMPVIVGGTAEETMQFVNSVGPVPDEPSYAAAIERVFGAAQRDAILARYPASRHESPRRALVALTTDAFFTCSDRRVARRLAAAQDRPVFRYLFAHALENDPELRTQGAVHTVEHPFLFAWPGRYRPSPADLAVQALLLGYWTRMARAGDPNGGGAPHWPAVTPERDAYLRIGAVPAAGTGPAEAQCDFWDGVPLPWPHL